VRVVHEHSAQRKVTIDDARRGRLRRFETSRAYNESRRYCCRFLVGPFFVLPDFGQRSGQPGHQLGDRARDVGTLADLERSIRLSRSYRAIYEIKRER